MVFLSSSEECLGDIFFFGGGGEWVGAECRTRGREMLPTRATG